MSSIFQVITVCCWRVLPRWEIRRIFLKFVFFFCGGHFQPIVVVYESPTFFCFWSLNWGFSKKGQFLGSLGLIWEQNLRRRFLGLKDPGGFVKIAGFYLTFTFVVWKSDFFGIRPSWKVIPEKMGLKTSFFLTHQVGEDQTREMYGNFWDSLHNSALFGLVM